MIVRVRVHYGFNFCLISEVGNIRTYIFSCQSRHGLDELGSVQWHLLLIMTVALCSDYILTRENSQIICKAVQSAVFFSEKYSVTCSIDNSHYPPWVLWLGFILFSHTLTA